SRLRALSCHELLCAGAHSVFLLFLVIDTPTTEIYTLSLHDALPIYLAGPSVTRCGPRRRTASSPSAAAAAPRRPPGTCARRCCRDRKSTRLNSSHLGISYAVFCLKKKT